MCWMVARRYTLDRLTQAGCPNVTLASNYLALPGSASAWTDFSAAVDEITGGVSSDNPWTAAVHAMLT